MRDTPERSGDYKARKEKAARPGSDTSHYGQQATVKPALGTVRAPSQRKRAKGQDLVSQKAESTYDVPRGDQRTVTYVINHSGIKTQRRWNRPGYGSKP